ncbi:MAG: hypothetical protein L6R28_03370 [Planctomycetes bacterium]|nr:hypothetical protein [Planctomycetota bacterium]
MARTNRLEFLVALLLAAQAAAGEGFAKAPAAQKNGAGATITFALAAAGDVEVAVLDAKGGVVRHLAAGALGAPKAPPAPLKEGLEQSIAWDGHDDFGKPAQGGPFQARVRLGLGAKFGRLIGADPYNFGAIDSIACDEDGNLYVLGIGGDANQGHLVLRAFDPAGKYLREILPFPADLAPDAMKEIATWDAERKTFRPRTLKSLNPDFYDDRGIKWGAAMHLVGATKDGVLLTDGGRICKLDPRGRVPQGSFTVKNLWAKDKGNPNTGGGPTFLAVAPGGSQVYLSGPYSSKTQYGHPYIADFPPGRIYRMPLDGAETLGEFATVPVEHQDGQGGAWLKACKAPDHFTVPKGPVHQIAFDGQGNVYVCDRERQRITVFDANGKETGYLPVANPGLVAVHPKTGAVYAMEYDCVAYGQFKKVLMKFEKAAADAKPVATYDFGTEGRWPSLALSAGKDRTLLWVSGVKGDLVALEDKGTELAPIETNYKPGAGRQRDWNKIAVDFGRDEIYASNGTTGIWRYDGQSGEGGQLAKDGKPFQVNDLAVGYDGLLYVRVSGSQTGTAPAYSGPLWRMDRELNAVPYEATGTHVLTPYIYSRFGVGFAERGLGVGPKGECYISFMYKWVAYAVGGFTGDGKPMPGKYLKGAFPAADEKSRAQYPAGWDAAVIGPVPTANAGIRVDLQGNIYVGMLYWPKEVPLPLGKKPDDRSWTFVVGSVIKFGPDGGRMTNKNEGDFQPEGLEGAQNIYPGLAPFSRDGFGGNTCCVCRVPRFDLDRYGRLALPNAVTNSVWVYDNAGNPITEIGRYGNFDSQFVNPFGEGEKKDKPQIAVPEIPLAWPTAVGFSEKHLYVNDTLSRRIVRADLTYAHETLAPVK